MNSLVLALVWLLVDYVSYSSGGTRNAYMQSILKEVQDEWRQRLDLLLDTPTAADRRDVTVSTANRAYLQALSDVYSEMPDVQKSNSKANTDREDGQTNTGSTLVLSVLPVPEGPSHDRRMSLGLHLPVHEDYSSYGRVELVLKKKSKTVLDEVLLHVCLDTSSCSSYNANRKVSVNHLAAWDALDVTDIMRLWQSVTLTRYQAMNTSSTTETTNSTSATNTTHRITISIESSQLDLPYSVSDATLVFYQVLPDVSRLRYKLRAGTSRIGRHANRGKRSVQYETDDNECGLRSWYVSFADIKFDDYIISPDGIQANYCSGPCTRHMRRMNKVNGTNHAYLKFVYRNMYRVSQHQIPGAQCVPSQLSPINIITNIDSALRVKTMYRMVADSCGCQ